MGLPPRRASCESIQRVWPLFWAAARCKPAYALLNVERVDPSRSGAFDQPTRLARIKLRL
jgi:hypothetical protein